MLLLHNYHLIYLMYQLSMTGQNLEKDPETIAPPIIFKELTCFYIQVAYNRYFHLFDIHNLLYVMSIKFFHFFFSFLELLN